MSEAGAYGKPIYRLSLSLTSKQKEAIEGLMTGSPRKVYEYCDSQGLTMMLGWVDLERNGQAIFAHEQDRLIIEGYKVILAAGCFSQCENADDLFDMMSKYRLNPDCVADVKAVWTG